MKKFVLLKMLTVMACLMCSMSTFAVTRPYVVYTSEDSTMTFYYDDQRGSRPGFAMDLNAEDYDPDWKVYGIRNIVSVVFDPSFADARPTSTYSWFYEMRPLTSISTGM